MYNGLLGVDLRWRVSRRLLSEADTGKRGLNPCLPVQTFLPIRWALLLSGRTVVSDLFGSLVDLFRCQKNCGLDLGSPSGGDLKS
jgi:hypothetical protein